MANYGGQMKLLIDNKPIENPDEDEQKQVEKKAKAFKAATEKKEKLNDFFYECMIHACSNFKSVIRQLS